MLRHGMSTLRPSNLRSKFFIPYCKFSSSSSPSCEKWRQVMAEFQRKANDTNASFQATDVEKVIHICTENQRPREAMSVVYKAENCGIKISLQSYLQICSSWARKGQSDRALTMMAEVPKRFGDQFQLHSVKTPADCYDPLLSVFERQHDWRSTHNAITQMHELGFTPTIRAFRVFMLTLAKARRKDTLLTTITFVEKKFPKLWTDVKTLTAMSQALGSVDEHQRVLEIYRKLDAEWIRKHASTVLFNQFLLAAVRLETTKTRDRNLSKRKNLNDVKAKNLFEHMMKSRNAPPDDFTFATYMASLEKRGEWKSMLDLFNTMLETQTRNQITINNKLNAPVVNPLSCAAVIRALHKLNETSESLKEKKAVIDDKKHLNKPSNALQRKLKQDLSVVLKQLQTINLRNIGHASTLIDTLDEFKLFTAARQVFQRLLDEGIIETTPWRLKDGFEIDLHTFSRGIAKCAIVAAFNDITRSYQGTSDASFALNAPLQNLRIITGVGKRSRTFMKPILRQEITELLTKSSRPALWPSVHPTNPGVLLVRQNALRKWLAKGGEIRYF